MRNTSSGTSWTNCFNSVLVRLEQPDRFCGMLENSQRRVESLPCSRLGSAAKYKLNGSVPNCEVERSKGESLQKLYQDVCLLMSLVYPGESPALSDIIGRDAFQEALDDQVLQMRILEKEQNNLDDALNLASRLEAFNIKGSTGQEADKGRSRFVRAAAGGKESTGSEVTKMSEEILKQLT